MLVPRCLPTTPIWRSENSLYFGGLTSECRRRLLVRGLDIFVKLLLLLIECYLRSVEVNVI